MFITPAFAQATPAPGGGDFIMQLVPFLLIFVIMYFLIIRPQQKRVKEHREMIAAIRRGDVVVTGGGIIGKVVRVLGDNELRVEIADGVQIRLVKASVTEVRAKTEPVRGRARPEPEDEDDDEGDEGLIEEAPEERKPRRALESAAVSSRQAASSTNGRKPSAKQGRKSRTKAQLSTKPVRTGQTPHPPAGAQTGQELADAANREAVIDALEETSSESLDGGKTQQKQTKPDA